MCKDSFIVFINLFGYPLDASPPQNALKKGWCGFLRQPLPHGECRRRQAHDKLQALNE